MAITLPTLFTPILDAEVNYKRSVSEETYRKLAQNLNLLGKLAPIGTIRAVQLNHPGVAAPDADIWQLCNGDEITHPLSPLRTVGLTERFTPDLTGRYVRGAPSDSVNNFGGADTLNLNHSHGGATSIEPDLGALRGDAGAAKTPRVPHTHPIGADLNSAETLDTAHQVIAFYIKIT